jgi:ABC-type multidrug transport system fused ATPase/permease subunit
VLRDGKVVEAGAETELMERKGEFYRLATTGS